jgi:hypothetical protein
MTKNVIRQYDPVTGALLKTTKYNPWLNINNANTQKRLVKELKKETAILQKRVDFLRSSRDRLKNGEGFSVKYIEDLARKTGDKDIITKARRFAREHKGYTPKRLESTYEALTKEIEDNIINIQQKRVVNDVTERVVSYPARRTAQTTAVQIQTDEALKKMKGAKYVRYVLNPNRTWKGKDVCDVCAGRNPEGKGRGVYKIGEVPRPPLHPNCGCLLVPFE